MRESNLWITSRSTFYILNRDTCTEFRDIMLLLQVSMKIRTYFAGSLLDICPRHIARRSVWLETSTMLALVQAKRKSVVALIWSNHVVLRDRVRLSLPEQLSTCSVRLLEPLSVWFCGPARDPRNLQIPPMTSSNNCRMLQFEISQIADIKHPPIRPTAHAASNTFGRAANDFRRAEPQRYYTSLGKRRFRYVCWLSNMITCSTRRWVDI